MAAPSTCLWLIALLAAVPCTVAEFDEDYYDPDEVEDAYSLIHISSGTEAQLQRASSATYVSGKRMLHLLLDAPEVPPVTGELVSHILKVDVSDPRSAALIMTAVVRRQIEKHFQMSEHGTGSSEIKTALLHAMSTIEEVCTGNLTDPMVIGERMEQIELALLREHLKIAPPPLRPLIELSILNREHGEVTMQQVAQAFVPSFLDAIPSKVALEAQGIPGESREILEELAGVFQGTGPPVIPASLLAKAVAVRSKLAMRQHRPKHTLEQQHLSSEVVEDK